ncbi:MAG TPA: hypothetical protein VHT34_08040 [Clostridia bacterium]|nr:hypothetical protein [Clostridia bacterium]
MTHLEENVQHEHEHCHGPKIEAGQILNPDCFPPPNELVCIQVPKVFDQVALRDCITKCIPLKHCHDDDRGCHDDSGCQTKIAFEGAVDFEIKDIRVISKTDALGRPGFKKLKLAVTLSYKVILADGNKQMIIPDEAVFSITVNAIYCPDCVAEIGIVKSSDHFWDKNKTYDVDDTFIKVEALAEAFNGSVNHHNVLSFDIGVFFIVKCECVVQLLIPAYGYCPVPPEQRINPAIQNCTIFNDRLRTPFPTKFFPDQKWNPLDKRED